MNAKQVFTNPRVIIFLIAVVLALVAINPHPFNKGVAIRSVVADSAAAAAGIEQPSPKASPVSRERILEINNQPIDDIAQYYALVQGLESNQSIQIKTNKQLYRVTVRGLFDFIELNETEKKIVTESYIVNETANGTSIPINKTRNVTKIVPKTKIVERGVEDIGLKVFPAPKTNIRKGLDLQGGTRVLLQPAEILSEEDLSSLIGNMGQRLNVYGLSDLIIRDASDLSGNQYILVEIAGANDDEIKNLLSKQGKFEAIINGQTVFRGGEDIKFVCKSADCAGIDPSYGCQAQDINNYACRFRFSITISPQAAQRQADVTRDIPLAPEDTRYLSAPLELYLDDVKTDELSIGTDLQGAAVTEIQISGSGFGSSQQEAVLDAVDNMKNLQTILITGSLPVKLNIVKIDSISPLLGESFLYNAIIAGLVALATVIGYVLFTYRKIAIALPMALTATAELVILLGVAALIGWNIDLAAVAGIIIAIGTGINHQIVIADETIRGQKQSASWKDRFKNAFGIILGSYFTLLVAMIPLFLAGAGLLKGFALTSIIGASIGVFITRPVYAKVVEFTIKE